MFELKKIHFLSALKVSATLALTVGSAAVAVYFIILSFNIFGYSYGYLGIEELVFVPLAIFISSGIGLVILAVIMVPLYNLIAEHFGGIEIDLVRADNAQ